MLAQYTPFLIAHLPAIVVAPTIAVLGLVLVMNAPSNAGKTSDNNDLGLHHQVSNELN